MSLIECIDLTIFCNFAQKTLAYIKKNLFICSNFDEIFLTVLYIYVTVGVLAKLTKKDVFLELCHRYSGYTNSCDIKACDMFLYFCLYDQRHK